MHKPKPARRPSNNEAFNAEQRERARPRVEQVVRMRNQGMTLSEIGDILGVSASRVSHLVRAGRRVYGLEVTHEPVNAPK